ncbi:hypothetical protein EJ06DRAFT_427640 [Trichodelitschia bisporula]|uniref:Uncharacterized protein n=1 Tax=Trichodelitschia bisporula TaxID=703511 RepID=A0A6G1HWD7_9PEZI|nr:hypothetical protein EJ06DRAFT_427640 [Trichodelitschia bisporula]
MARGMIRIRALMLLQLDSFCRPSTRIQFPWILHAITVNVTWRFFTSASHPPVPRTKHPQLAALQPQSRTPHSLANSQSITLQSQTSPATRPIDQPFPSTTHPAEIRAPDRPTTIAGSHTPHLGAGKAARPASRCRRETPRSLIPFPSAFSSKLNAAMIRCACPQLKVVCRSFG